MNDSLISSSHTSIKEARMIGMLMEAVVLAFVIGGIIGAVTALHLSSLRKIPVKIQSDTRHRRNNGERPFNNQ
jgi:hypothetical protein